MPWIWTNPRDAHTKKILENSQPFFVYCILYFESQNIFPKWVIFVANQLLAHSRWFSSGIPASSTTKTGRHDIAKILLKVALKKKIYIGSGYLNHILCHMKMLSRVSNEQFNLLSSRLELTKKSKIKRLSLKFTKL
jgi:hypothetical protein